MGRVPFVVKKMKNYFQESADNLALAETESAGYDANGKPLPSVATLTFTTLFNGKQPLTIPVTHTKIDGDSRIMAEGGGFSSLTMLERCEFRSSFFTAAQLPLIKKGFKCSLTIKAGLPPKSMQLWTGGLLAGGEIFRFELVSADFKG